jgi:hypothetical protein
MYKRVSRNAVDLSTTVGVKQGNIMINLEISTIDKSFTFILCFLVVEYIYSITAPPWPYRDGNRGDPDGASPSSLVPLL